MESVVRMVVEPLFETVLKRLTELDKKLITIDTKMNKMENEMLVLKWKIDSRLSIPDSNNCMSSNCMSSNYKMEEVD
jgi:hypothetical protein